MLVVSILQLATHLAIFSWSLGLSVKWKNLREDAVRLLQEEAVNQKDLAVVLELTLDMVSSATKD